MQPPSRLKRFIGTFVIGGAVLFMIFAALLPDVFSPVPTTSGPLAHDAYVWQRARSDALNDAIRNATDFRRLLVLAGQIRFDGDDARVTVIDLDPAPLAGRTLTLVIRIDSLPGAIAEPAIIERVTRGIARIVDASSASGLTFDELQIDFDAAESQLHAYREWLLAIKRQHPTLRLSCTTLMSHVDSSGFARVVRAVDSFVLQLHALPPHPTPTGPLPLLDVDRAQRAIRSAARLRVDFSIALPTYSYRLIFDASGKLTRVLAEQDQDDLPPPGGMSRVVRSDPSAIAAFVRSLEAHRPEPLKVIAWYRLPIATDQHNWHHSTLDAVGAGVAPAGRVEAVIDHPPRGLREIVVVNSGNDDAPPPERLTVSTPGGLIAFDATSGYTAQRSTENGLQFVLAADSMELLRPGQRRVIGWIRLERDTEVAVEVSIQNPSP